MTDQPEPTEPPGPAVRWVTITQQFDRDDRLISERITETRERELNHPEPPRHIGFYL